MNQGLANGLAYRHDYKSAVSAYQREDALNRQAETQKMAQTRMMMDEIGEAPAVMGTYDKENIAEGYQDMITQVGSYATQNPGYASSIEGMMGIKSITSAWQNDPKVLGAVSSTENFKQMQTFLAKNPEYNNHPQIAKQKEAWKMYDKHGSIDGVSESGFVFMNPAKLVDVEKMIAETSKGMQNNDVQMDQNGAFEAVSQGSYVRKANAMLSDSGQIAMDLKAQFSDLEEKGQTNGMSINAWLVGRLKDTHGRNYTKQASDSYSAKNGGSGEGSNGSVYHNLFNNPVGKIDPSYLEEFSTSNYNKETGMLRLEKGAFMIDDKVSNDPQFFTGEGGSMPHGLQKFMNGSINNEYKSEFTGNTIKMEDAIDEGTGMTSRIGAEVMITVPYEKNKLADRQLFQSLEEEGKIKNSEWAMFSSIKDIEDVGNVETLSKNIYFTTETNADGDLIRVAKIKMYVPFQSNSRDQMSMDKGVQGQKNSQFEKPSNTKTGANTKFMTKDGVTYRKDTQPDGTFNVEVVEE